jgi:integrase
MAMPKGQNYNHPPKGAKIAVSPIRDPKDIEKIKQLLAKSPRNYCLFTLAVNSSLRGGDLLGLKVRDVKDLKPGEILRLREQKTKKARLIPLNEAAVKSIQALLKSRPYTDEDFLFYGRKGALTLAAFSRLVKNWCKAVGLSGNFGSHSLRKSWGFHMRTRFGVGMPLLMTAFNHSSERTTLRYLGITSEEVRKIYMNEL